MTSHCPHLICSGSQSVHTPVKIPGFCDAVNVILISHFKTFSSSYTIELKTNEIEKKIHTFSDICSQSEQSE